MIVRSSTLALAGKGVIVKHKAFHNLNASQLQQHMATATTIALAPAEPFSGGMPILVRGGNAARGASSEVSKAHFGKLLKQVTNHLSSVSNIFVHDGAIGSSSKCDAKVRLISDSPSAVLSLSRILWGTSPSAVSRDSCPLTVYVATSLSPGIEDAICLGSKGNNGFIAADIERLSLVLCGQAFSDSNGTKEALAALSGPVIFARGGLPLSARDLLVPSDAGVILYSQGVAPLFLTSGSNLFKLPDAVVVASSDSSGVIPPVSKFSPSQAAYNFLAGYQNGKFVPAYCKNHPSIDPLELAKALFSKLNDEKISSYLLNVNGGEKNLTGEDFAALVQTTLSKNIPPLHVKGGVLHEKYQSFLLSKFDELPKEFSF